MERFPSLHALRLLAGRSCWCVEPAALPFRSFRCCRARGCSDALLTHRCLQTDVTGARRYGTCLAFCWPPVHKTQDAPPAELQSTHSLCLLSRVPVADTARKLLRILHMLLSYRLDPAHAALSSVDAFTEVATQIVTEVPSAVGIRVRLRFAGQLSHDSICCHLSAPRELPSQDLSLLLLFQCLSIRHVLLVLACLCTERSVVFTSRSTSLPPRCWEAMLSLLWPLQWTLVYVPLLPDSLSTYLQAPTIFAYGVHTAALEEQVQEPDGLSGVVIVDLDSDTVTGTDATPRLPQLAADALHQSVRAVLHPGIEDVDDPFSDMESTTTGPMDDAIRERKIRCAFAAFFASLLLHVDAHIAGVETSEDNPEENDDEIVSLTDQRPGFAELLKSGFLEDWSKGAGPRANLDLPFMEDFIQTQMVTVFVDQRRRWGQKVREATKDGVAEDVMLEFVDSPWEQLRRLAAVRNERSFAQAPSIPSSGGRATSEEELLARIERGGPAPPLYEVTIALNRNQPVSLDGPTTELPSRVHALSEKLNSAIMQSPVPAVARSPASMDAMEEFYADGTVEPELVRFYQDQERVDDSEFYDAETHPDFLLVRNETMQQQTHRKVPPQQPEPEPEQLSYFRPANACDALDSGDTKLLALKFNAPAQWSSVDFWHARVSRLVAGLTATLCTRPKAAHLHLYRAAAYESLDQPLAALQDYVRAWCLDRFLRNDIGGGEIVLQRLCNVVGRIDSKIGPEAAILGYAVRGLNTVAALADALIGQAGERQLGELLHQCVAIARSAVPEAPTPTPAEAEAVAEEESRLTPPFDSILARSSASLEGLDRSVGPRLRRSRSFDYLEADDSDGTPPISPQATKMRRRSESIATTVGQTPSNLRHRRSLSTYNFGTPSPSAVDTWERNERSVSRSNSSALNAIPDGAQLPISLADWVDANKSVAGLPPKMERLHGRGQVDAADTDFLSFLPVARIGACAASEVCLRLLIRQFQAVALPGGLVCDEKQLQHIKSQPEYKEKFLDRVRDLQTYNPAVLPPDEKVCFFVNVYNTMAMHAYVELGVPTSLLGRLSLMKRTSYAINDLEYSLYEIEHSVLRACASKPAIIGAGVLLSLAKFGESDLRYACRIEQVEPLLNFALCPGTASAPPLRVFTPVDFQTQLRMQAETYCGQYIKLDEHKCACVHLHLLC